MRAWPIIILLAMCGGAARADEALVEGWLAFNLVHGGRVYTNVVRLDGSGQQTVHAADGLVDTSLSADGRNLIGARPGDRSTITTVSLDGRGVRDIATIEGWAFSPTWSPDMRSIAFCLVDQGGPRVWVMTADGKDARPVSDAGTMSPHWSSDGKRLAYVKWNPGGGRGAIKLTDVTTGARMVLLEGDAPITDVAWSPGDRRLAFTVAGPDGTQVYLVNADASNATPVTQSPGARSGLRFSADGHALFYSRAERGGRVSTLIRLVPGAAEQEIMRAAPGDLIMMNGGLLRFWAASKKH